MLRDRRYWLVAGCVLAIAAAVRLTTYLEIADGPALHLRVWTQSDMHFFDRWARAIVAGDVLTQSDMRPYHGRHRRLACAALTGSEQPGAACDDDAIRAVWDRWVGKGTFWQDPLYPYVLAVTYRLFGDGYLVGYLLNVLLGLGCVALVFYIGAEIGGLFAGATAAVVAAFYGPLVFYETLLLREVAICCAGLAMVACTMKLLRDGAGAKPAIAAGLSCGVSVLLKASALVYVVMVPPMLVATRRHSPGQAVRLTAAFVIAFVVALAPLVARNAAVGVPAFSVASTGALNFVNGNAADRISPAGSSVSALAAGIMDRSGGDTVKAVIETIRTHARLRDWLRALGRKFVAFWAPAEVPNNASYDYFSLLVPRLRPLLLGFPLLAALTVVGLRRGLAAGAAVVPLLAYAAAGIGVCVLFYDLARFRLPVACAMMPLAGCAIADLRLLVRARSWMRTALRLACIVGIAMLLRALPYESETMRIADYGVSNRIALHLARDATERGDVATALATLRRQLATEPPELTAIEPGPEATRISTTLSGVSGTFVEVHRAVAQLYERSGAAAQAGHHRHRAAVLEALNAPYRAHGYE